MTQMKYQIFEELYIETLLISHIATNSVDQYGREN